MRWPRMHGFPNRTAGSLDPIEQVNHRLGARARRRQLESRPPPAVWNTISRERSFLLAASLFNLGPRVLQRHGSVKDWLARRAVGIQAEIAESLKLIARLRCRLRQSGFHLRICDDFQ